MYVSGTLGAATTAHWDADALRSSLAPLESLTVADVPPIDPDDFPPKPDGFDAPRNQTDHRLWLGTAGVLARTHYDKGHNLFSQVGSFYHGYSPNGFIMQVCPSQIRGRKSVLLFPPSQLPLLHLYPAVHTAYRQSQAPPTAAATLAAATLAAATPLLAADVIDSRRRHRSVPALGPRGAAISRDAPGMQTTCQHAYYACPISSDPLYTSAYIFTRATYCTSRLTGRTPYSPSTPPSPSLRSPRRGKG